MRSVQKDVEAILHDPRTRSNGTAVAYVPPNAIRSLSHYGWHHEKISVWSDTETDSHLGASLTGVAGREREVAIALGKLFVQRRDVKAVQNEFTGNWSRRTEPIKMGDVVAHVLGKKSIGHYLIDPETDKCRVFALDIDIVDSKMETLKDNPDPELRAKYVPQYFPMNPSGPTHQLTEYNPRMAWHDRAHPARLWTKRALSIVAAEIAVVIMNDLGLPCLVSYSGNKGLHVYAVLHQDLGGPGPIPAEDAREGAVLALEKTGMFVPGKGKNFYKAIDQDPVLGFPQLEVEVFPKQGTVGPGGYGNLMRLPLGRNFKSEKDKAFFMDFSQFPYGFAPVDPLKAMSICNPFEGSYIKVPHTPGGVNG